MDVLAKNINLKIDPKLSEEIINNLKPEHILLKKLKIKKILLLIQKIYFIILVEEIVGSKQHL